MNGKTFVVTLASLALVAVGCSSGQSGKVSVSAGAATSAGAGAAAGSLDLGQGIAVTAVQLCVKKIALEGPAAPADAGAPDTAMLAAAGSTADQGSGDAGSAEGTEKDDDDGDENEVKVGPFPVSLSADQLASGSLTQVFDGQVPAGSYKEIKIVIAPAGSSGDAGSGTDCGMDSSSVIIAGTVDGQDFTFKSSLHAAQEHETDMTVTVDGSTKNVTLTVDPTGWFKDAKGDRLDPTAAANQSAIEDNIKASIKAFEDDDKDGLDDRDEHGGTDGGQNDPAGHS